MACLKGKSENKPRKGRFRCERCGAVSKKENHLCKPKELTKKALKKFESKKEKAAKD
jgi:hypothetical protein